VHWDIAAVAVALATPAGVSVSACPAQSQERREAPIEHQNLLEPDVPTIYEIEGGGSLLPFYPAFAR
jgi:hypothetical protein